MIYTKLEREDKDLYIDLMKKFRPLDENMSTEKFDEIYQKIFQTGSIIICKTNKKIIGSITVILEYKFINNFSIYGHIEDVFVDEKQRHKKIGKKLVEEAVNFCKEKKCFKICLNCDEKLKKFYSLNGFENRQINMSRLV
tara:strand:- start:527 stop:946 length:420 start_codon:yes stop_codon:yes gene_type:complete